MSAPRSSALAVVSALILGSAVACGGSAEPDVGARPDGGTPPDTGAVLDGGRDAGFVDAAPRDAGFEDAGPIDMGFVDAGTPDSGASDLVGIISGACGELDVELTSPSPSTFVNHIEFPNGFSMADEARLSEGAQEILREGTAGGSSGLSEALAFEILSRCEGAILELSEREVMYEPMDSKKTDLVATIDGLRIGVSVTRAVGFPRDDPYTVSRARDLLTDKFGDILVSSANVVPEQAWTKQILHVIAYGPMHAASMQAAEAMIAPEVRADTILWISVTDGDDDFIY